MTISNLEKIAWGLTLLSGAALVTSTPVVIYYPKFYEDNYKRFLGDSDIRKRKLRSDLESLKYYHKLVNDCNETMGSSYISSETKANLKYFCAENKEKYEFYSEKVDSYLDNRKVQEFFAKRDEYKSWVDISLSISAFSLTFFLPGSIMLIYFAKSLGEEKNKKSPGKRCYSNEGNCGGKGDYKIKSKGVKEKLFLKMNSCQNIEDYCTKMNKPHLDASEINTFI